MTPLAALRLALYTLAAVSAGAALGGHVAPLTDPVTTLFLGGALFAAGWLLGAGHEDARLRHALEETTARAAQLATYAAHADAELHAHVAAEWDNYRRLVRRALSQPQEVR